ncbi:MAG: SMC-Scp complex subunit ScpB [Calditrichia bacterium]|nr:SMC-Scp complex subunit ScpB [Calditrichia bacterium]
MEIKNKNIVESLLFVSSKPIKSKEIVKVINNDEITEKNVKEIIDKLNEEYSKNSKPFFIKNVAGGYRYYIKDEYFPYLEELIAEKRRNKLTQKALETLAIIAYKQPVTRSEIEAIRGVNADYIVGTLMERNLIMVSGRAHAPGNPLLYNTTPYFLEYFGLNHLEDLPKLKEIDEILEGDSLIKKEIGDVILHEIMPQDLGMVPEEEIEEKSEEDNKEVLMDSELQDEENENTDEIDTEKIYDEE